jgi:septum formation protein
MKKIVLASCSPRRRQLLEQSGLSFTVFPSTVKEKAKSPGQEPEVYALSLALAKAENVAQRFKNSLVIAADTIVVCDNKLFGKPLNQKHAKKILSALSGKIHYVYTAVAIIDRKTNRRIIDIEKTTLIAKKLSHQQIENLSKYNHDKAGAYAVQKDADILVKEMKGDYFNVVGLPLKRVKNILKIFSINLKDLPKQAN